jgi:hypothetical protein
VSITNSTEDATVNASEQTNPNSTVPAVSEQTIAANASVPSLSTPNLNPSSPSASAAASSVKRAQATEAQPSQNKRRCQGPFINTVISTVITSADGGTVVMNKKRHKERSDKGKKRVK